MIQGHGGNLALAARKAGCRPEEIVDVSSNINPLGMLPGLSAHLKKRLSLITHLPEVDGGSASEGMAAYLGVEPASVLMGNGTTQFIYAAVPALQPEKVLIVGPTYADYTSACNMYSLEPDFFIADQADNLEINCRKLGEAVQKYDLVYLCNPNNPTGQLIPHTTLLQLCRENQDTFFIIDESYLDFAPVEVDKSMTTCELDNVAVLWSVSKIFAVPGLRSGFLVARPAVIERFIHFMQPWCANSLAQEAVCYLTRQQDETKDYVLATKDYLAKENALLRKRLASTRLKLYPTVTPFSLIALPEGVRSDAFCDRLLQDRLLIRDCSNFQGLDHSFVRISLKTPEINEQVAHLLASIEKNP